MKVSNRTVSYFALLNHFWALDELESFSTTATKFYFLLLHNANKNRWPLRFPYADTRAAAAVGVSVAKLKTARKQLVDAGLIQVVAGGNGHAQKTMYSLTGCADCEHHNSAECVDHCQKVDSKVGGVKSHPKQQPTLLGDTLGGEVGANVGCKNDLPNPQPLLIRQNKDKTKTPPSSNKEGDEIFDFDNLQAPLDGVNRNFDGLREKLKSLGASPADAKRILALSNFGQIGHPVWAAFAELRNAIPGAIKSPVRFIMSRLQEPMSNFPNA